MMPSASIVIPTFNSATYLPDAIDSVLGQSYGKCEVIVVDDGSTDETAEVAALFGDAIRYVYQENRGLSAARNHGLILATGEYIALLDADDLLEPDYLERMLGSFETHPDAGAIYCGFQMVDEKNQVLFQRGRTDIVPDFFYEQLLFGNFIVAPGMLVNRTAYERAGLFDEALSACEDWDMWLRIAGRETIFPMDASLVRYRIRGGSMSSNPQRMLANRLAVLAKQRDLVSAKRYARALAYAYRIATFEWLQAGDETQALSCFCEAAEHYPPLLAELETYYELALWDQPKGHRGDLRHIDVSANENALLHFLGSLFASASLTADCQIYRKVAFARAYEALARISYGRRDMKLARNYLRRSLSFDRSQITATNFALTMIKSALSPRLLPNRPTTP